MSRPESTGESLEAILASIRSSLSEQSTDVLEDDAALPADAGGDEGAAPEQLRDGLAWRLAQSATEASQLDDPAPDWAEPHATEPAAEQELPGPAADEPLAGAALLQPATPAVAPATVTPDPAPAVAPTPAPTAAPAAATPAPATAKAEKDPLWFLGGRGQPAARQNEAAPARPAGLNGKAAPSGVVRGPLPPFFGSKAEAQKAEVVLVQPGPSGMGVMPPPAAQPPSHGPNGASGPPTEMPPPPIGVPPQAADLLHGRVSSLFGPAADGKAGPGGTPHVNALEAMVLELLRPMLRQWLDENMPRLVSAALRDQARATDRDPGKP